MFFGDSKNTVTFGNRLNVYVTVQPGMTATDIGEMLEERGVIGSRQKFWLIAKLGGSEGRFKAGTYNMYVNMPIREALDVLLGGEASRSRRAFRSGRLPRGWIKRGSYPARSLRKKPRPSGRIAI